MKTVDIARRAWRSLNNAKARTILTSLAMGVGAFTIAISLAAGEGSRQYAEELIGSNINPQALFIVKDSTLFESDPLTGSTGLQEYSENSATSPAGVNIESLSQEDVDALAARDDLENVIPIYTPVVEYMTFGDSDFKFSADVANYDATLRMDAAYGTLPDQGTDIGDDEAVVPESFVTTLVDQGIIDSPEDAIGLEVTLFVQGAGSVSTEELAAAFAQGGEAAAAALVADAAMEEFTVTIRGVQAPSDTALVSANSFQVSANMARDITEYLTKGTDSYQEYFGATALVVEGAEPDDVKAVLIEEGYGVQTAYDLQAIVFTIVNTLQGIVLGFGVIALIASVFGIINTQYISVLERTREIGLMKALGMRGRSVSRLFQFEAAWIGFLGGLIGTVIAVTAGTAANPSISEALGLGDHYLLIFQPISIGVMVLALIIVAMLAGWFPARKAAKLDPIEALRTE